jgi:tetratricopeptide (TPR) repeat protein
MPPSPVHPLVRRARAALAQGHLQIAATLVQQRLEEFSGDANALMTLADIQLVSGHGSAAIETMRQAVRRVEGNPLLHAKLAHMLLRESRWTDALDAADRALKLDPACMPAIAVKCTVFERQDRYAKAERLLAPHIAADRPNADIGPTAMRVLLHAGRLEEAVAFADRYERSHPEDTRTLREVRFELARAHERGGDLDAAFAAVEQANRTAAPRWDRAAEAARFDAITAATPRAAMDAMPVADPGDDAPPIVFIVGMPRSGGTLLERILHAHPDASGIGEDPAIHRVAYGLHRHLGGGSPYPASLAMLTAEAVAAVRGEALAEMRKRSGRGRVIVSKALGNALHLGLISRLFPEARVVHARRDAMDTCLSGWMEPLGGPGSGYASRLEDLGWYHRRLDAMLEHWRHVTDLPILDVQYEHLVADQRAVTESLLAHAGLPWNDACLEFHRVKRVEQTLSFDQVRRPLYGGSVGRAARYGERLDPLRAALAGEDAAAGE